MTRGLGIEDRSAPELDRAGLRLDGTEPLADRARLLVPQERCLTLEEVGDGAAGDGAGGRDRGLLDVVGIQIEVRPDRTVITYAHLGFTMRQIMFSPEQGPAGTGPVGGRAALSARRGAP